MTRPLLTTLLAILVITASTLYAQQSNRDQILQERSERDARFSDPIRSPLATQAIFLVNQERMVFGSSEKAHLVWKDSGVAPEQMELKLVDGRIHVHPLAPGIFTFPAGTPLTDGIWETESYLKVGSRLLLLQIHPVGPVVRVVDPQSKEVAQFKGLKYFPVDESYRVKGEVIPNTDVQPVVILDTQGWERRAWIYGKIRFDLDHRSHELSLIQFTEAPDPASEFMIIFRDKTSGSETYPACRYLFIPFKASGKVWLDFNRSSNPSCAYGDGFACPLPLPGNQLNIPIRAGEKTYPRSH